MAEFLEGFEASAWVAIGAPARTPPDIIDKLNKEINAALADPALRARIADLGGMVFSSSPRDLERFVQDQIEERANVIRAANIKPE
jgi:tripartite-type tricarboxylate transporter receptor subunit TctC